MFQWVVGIPYVAALSGTPAETRLEVKIEKWCGNHSSRKGLLRAWVNRDRYSKMMNDFKEDEFSGKTALGLQSRAIPAVVLRPKLLFGWFQGMRRERSMPSPSPGHGVS